MSYSVSHYLAQTRAMVQLARGIANGALVELTINQPVEIRIELYEQHVGLRAACYDHCFHDRKEAIFAIEYTARHNDFNTIYAVY